MKYVITVHTVCNVPCPAVTDEPENPTTKALGAVPLIYLLLLLLLFILMGPNWNSDNKTKLVKKTVTLEETIVIMI